MNNERLDQATSGKLEVILLKCKEFDSIDQLLTAFDDERIIEWRPNLPDKANNKKDRVIECYRYLFRHRVSESGEPVLVRFLHVLAEKNPVSDQLRAELTDIAEEIQARYGGQDSGILARPTASQSSTLVYPKPLGKAPKLEQEVVASDLLDWLHAWGFEHNPFKDKCWVAEQDTDTPTESWFWEPDNYLVDVRGTPDHFGATYILAPFGGGKTALLERLYFDLSVPGHGVLPVKYVVKPDQLKERYEANSILFPGTQASRVFLFTHGQMIVEELHLLNSESAALRSLATHIDVYSPWRQILAFCSENGRHGVTILVDIEVNRTSDIDWIMEDYIVHLGSLTLPGVVIKIFAPINQTRAKELGLRIDRGDVYTLQWNQSELQNLVRARIMGYRLRNVPGKNRLETQKEGYDTELVPLDSTLLAAGGEQAFDIFTMFEPEARTKVRQLVSEFVSRYPTPRAALMLGHEILAIHADFLSGHSQDGLTLEPLISKETVRRAIEICEGMLL